MPRPEPTPAITLDRTRRPAYFIRIQGKAGVTEMQAHLAQMSEILAQKQRYGTLVDLRDSAGMPREALKLNAEWNQKHRAEIERLTVGSAIVIKGAVTRAALSAALWMQPIPGPYAIFQDYALAEKWLRGALREARLPFYSSDQPPGFIANEA